MPLVLTLALPVCPASAAEIPPQPKREFRGAWIASVANIDWPSTNRLSTAAQKAELIGILDKAAALRLNAIILQVRPSCDALYASSIEPWSEYLTGEMGKPPQPFYDPLAFAVEEAHKRGMELHAWFNPYRAQHRSAKSPLSPNHIARKRPDLVKRYGPYLWLDPGEKDVQELSRRVVLDVLHRYDVDGIHFDDYFYPYKETANGAELDFPDDASWKKVGARTGLSRDDWRRRNVDTFLKDTYLAVKSKKPWVKFGVSPFGIWRPGYPAQIRGLDPYEKLYADSRKWLQEGWLDYIAPQLYWAIEPPAQSFPVLLTWWDSQNRHNRHVWPGLSSANVNPGKWPPGEIANQITITRQRSSRPPHSTLNPKPSTTSTGHIHWNISALTKRPDLAAALKASTYTEPALIPASPWLSKTAVTKPTLSVGTSSSAKGILLSWKPAASPRPTSRPSALNPQPSAFLWLLQVKRDGQWTTDIFPGSRNSARIPAAETASLRAVDRFGNVSPPALVRPPKKSKR